MDFRIIKELRDKTGCTLRDCTEALEIFNGSVTHSQRYLEARGLVVCKRDVDGSKWSDEEYIKYAKYVKGEDVEW